MRTRSLAVILIGCLSTAEAQTSVAFENLQAILDASKLEGTEASDIIEKAWIQITRKHRTPLISGDSIVFLYRGKAKKVTWLGDFNNWGNSKTYPSEGRQIGTTDIWMMSSTLPMNARADYKILVDATRWMLDPYNPYQQWSGVGGGTPNSEVRMPDWSEDPILRPRPDAVKGQLVSDLLFESQKLNYQVSYQVYLPPGYDGRKQYPALYVADGYEYLHPRMGNMTTVLDNLLTDGMIKPLIAIFIDHREPVNRSNNRRMEELAMNQKYLEFFISEFLPLVEGQYPLIQSPESRGVLGASMGGLNAAFVAFTAPNIVGLAGIQSPSFWFRPQIYALCESAERPKTRICMTSGVIYDAQEGSRKMKSILETAACQVDYIEINDGHSWGNWRGLIDDILIYLYPPE